MLGGDLNITDKKQELNLFSKANGIILNFVIELFENTVKKYHLKLKLFAIIYN